MQKITIQETQRRKDKPADEAELGFGTLFTDHMLVMDYDWGQGWGDMRIVPYGPFQMDPACCVLHYAQTIFEGLKCYRRADGGLQLFRPVDNFERMNISAQRLCMPQLDIPAVMEGLKALLRLDAGWVPSAPGTTLYIRPTLIATDNLLGVHASRSYRFFIILSPVGAYYASGLAPVNIYVEENLVRAVRGGVGFTKTGGNYAASILAGARAEEKGFAQVLWLDGKENRYIEEVGSMNMFFKFRDGLVTPPLNGSILDGITRRSVIQLAQAAGYPVTQRPLSVDEVFDAAEAGGLDEAFGTGTAAVISPVGMLQWRDRVIRLSGGDIGPLTRQLYDRLTGIQYGTQPDPFGWVTRLD
ncbi:MAG: branched-chain amino acid aminotransferase [Oscillospiraceae bacterium]|jgi:branched-chain amino acid aminotransferase|nr:branched-chain amino acid aminotransferase [Oscillospiraceae bacterium]